MSKVRVYEIAQELGLEHTIVENRCRELGIVVDNHLAQLSEPEVEQLKRALRDRPAGEVHQKRVRDTVIRRRRRAGKEPASLVNEETLAEALPESEAAGGDSTSSTEAATREGHEASTKDSEEVYQEAAAVSAPSEEAGSETDTTLTDSAQQGEEGAGTAPEGLGETPEAPKPVGKYGEGQAVNSPSEENEAAGRRRYVKVLGKIDPALAQNLNPRTPRRGARPAPTGGAPRGAPRGAPGPAHARGPSSPSLTPPNAPFADRSDKPGAASTRESEKKRRRRGGRVAYDRTKDSGFDDLRRARGRRGPKRRSQGGMTEITIPRASKRVVKMEETITVGELAQQLSIKAGAIIKFMMDMGDLVTVNNVIDLDTVTLIAQEYEFTVENVAFKVDDFVPVLEETAAEWAPRAPVVTVMGHVDHGKTSLLDYIRGARVAAGEAGGITQHLGAYRVPLEIAGEERVLVFLDTPGHAAFTAMRARGTAVTDVVILVVAADDGVMPQTVEAINHARAANVPIVVAVNKIDREDADPEKVRRELSEQGLLTEDWGGDVQTVNVSALQGDGVEALLEATYLQAEMLEPKAVINGFAKGVVIEAELSRGRGPVATVLVQEGTLKHGEIVVAGKAMGRVRALIDDKGENVTFAGPSTPVEILGLGDVPPPSERFFVVKDEKDARQVVAHLEDKEREKRLAGDRKRVSLEDLQRLAEEGEVKTLSLIIKSDVQGSLEALRSTFEKLEHPELEVRIIHAGVGPISESDVALAAASNAVVIGFNVRAEKKSKAVAEQERVEIKLYSVIYEAIDDVKAAMEGLLSPLIEEKVVGKAEIRDLFSLKGAGTIAGCAILQGKILRGAKARLFRDSRLIYTGSIESLRRFKENVPEVERGKECGIRLDNYGDVKLGDEIECFELVEVAQKLGL